ncbi:MAG: hypothetical protein ACOH2K_11750 [Burkholderiaceae bacterium]
MLALPQAFSLSLPCLPTVNHCFVKLATTIGVMTIALVLSAVVFGLDLLGLTSLPDHKVELVRSINFTNVLMHGMLSKLLFAGRCMWI